jgi:pyridinium-3,5-biscarboxylic acid mononucleotide synthase
MTVEELIEKIREGSTVDEVAEYLRTFGVVEVGLHRLDTHRERRSGSPEVVFGLGKSAEQVVEIVRHCAESGRAILVTKIDEAKASVIRQAVSDASYDRESRLLRLGTSPSAIEGTIAIVTAGSSDQPIAEEAAGTLEFFGMKPLRIYDCGVAGLHRMLAQGSTLAAADLLIVVAGMEGALPSVVAGLFSQPVIAVPTSVGYGASFEGLAALLGMLNSCAAGVTVVNIDNGFGAAIAARSMLRMAERRKPSHV